MAWYSTLFNELYNSLLGERILKSIQQAVESGDSKNAMLCYLAIRQFERIALSVSEQENHQLLNSLDNIKSRLVIMKCPLTQEEESLLKRILIKNGIIN